MYPWGRRVYYEKENREDIEKLTLGCWLWPTQDVFFCFFVFCCCGVCITEGQMLQALDVWDSDYFYKGIFFRCEYTLVLQVVYSIK